MDLTDPTSAITSTLDGPVLAVLAEAGKPLTVSEVANSSVRGSEIGIRKSLGRLVVQGIVTATELGNTRVYNLNREHVAANVAEALAGLRTELWQRIADAIESWSVRPLYACIYGSAARNDGDESSDIDLLLVRPATLPELTQAQKSKTTMDAIGMWADVIMTRGMLQTRAHKWESNIDDLRESVRHWSGNPLQVVDINAIEWSEQRRRKSTLYRNIQHDQIRLYDEFGPMTYRYSKDGGE